MTLPNFMLIGAAKCGTTSLYHYLKQHPDVFVSPVKEPNYFWHEGHGIRPSIKTRAEYERLFDGVNGETAIGEATSQYLNSPTAAERILGEVPGVRLIVSLRNPADRAYSAYLAWLRGGLETRAVGDALRPGNIFVEHGFYHPRLLRYYERFPADRIEVILFDELVAEPARVMRRLFEFLGVDPAFPIDTRMVHNRTRIPRSIRMNRWLLRVLRLAGFIRKTFLPRNFRSFRLAERLHQRTLVDPPRFDPVLRRRLLEHFADDIGRTGELVGRDLSPWLA